MHVHFIISFGVFKRPCFASNSNSEVTNQNFTAEHMQNPRLKNGSDQAAELCSSLRTLCFGEPRFQTIAVLLWRAMTMEVVTARSRQKIPVAPVHVHLGKKRVEV